MTNIFEEEQKSTKAAEEQKSAEAPLVDTSGDYRYWDHSLVMICPECGGLVSDVDTHKEFHRKGEK